VTVEIVLKNFVVLISFDPAFSIVQFSLV